MKVNESLDKQKEAFSLFDKHGVGTISSKDVGNVMRSLGRNPSEKELVEFLIEVDPTEEGTVELDMFLKLMSNHIPLMDPTEELLEAFQVLDNDNTNMGSISTQELRDILINNGEKLSEDEVDELLKQADENDTGYIKYREFAKIMTQ